ncbi:MAG: hypothetical protein HKN63_00825 [Rhodobacteraceae bacterium]|nr:hypothetical protein [Paracoccaceae bacterium]
MTASDQTVPGQGPAKRKPRIALMGEFSAGKSTLSNLMIGSDVIPMKVTATQLPPLWMSYGDDAPYREDLDGNQHPVDTDHLEDIPVSETSFVRLFAKVDLLEICDLIDTPGISDPNMPADVWQRAAEQADGVIWLTHATQAWRQSESAVWDSLPDTLCDHSLLLLTRMDKILNERDRERVVRRVEKETKGLFREVLPISLTEAMASEDDHDLWVSSGADRFTQSLLSLIAELETRKPPTARRRSRPVFIAPDPNVAANAMAKADWAGLQDAAAASEMSPAPGPGPRDAEPQGETEADAAPVSLRVENPNPTPLRNFGDEVADEDWIEADETGLGADFAQNDAPQAEPASEAPPKLEREREREPEERHLSASERTQLQLGAGPRMPPDAAAPGVMPRRVMPRRTADTERPPRERPVA